MKIILTALLFTTAILRAETVPNPLKVGDAVPDVMLRTEEDKEVSLRKLVSEKPTVLVFYRGGWCPFCNRHLQSLAGIEDGLNKAGAQLLAISPDQPRKLKETPDREKLHYRLLSDSSAVAAKAFGIAFKVDDATIEKYKTYKIDLDDASGHDHHILPHPAVFVVNTNGVIRFAHIDPDYKNRLQATKVLEATKTVKE